MKTVRSGLFGIIKAEMFNLHKSTDEASLQSAIDKYIYLYNYERFQELFDNRHFMEVLAAALGTDYPENMPLPRIDLF
ncbi:IS3 family transposase [Lutispora thermophila]|uniref:IS3 family transposase n=1 Tax=Lutispora thermophila TaxID=288966 RepID=UPI00093488B4|nr:IS3 family transposase [Lutispora thermophila]